jgi:predicted transcriptional regulator
MMDFGSSHRDKISIIRDILEVAKLEGRITKTAIMYKANLSHDQMKDYVRILTENNLLRYNLDNQKFETTEKGLRVIEIYKRLENMIKPQEVLPTPSLGQLQAQMQGGNKTKIK